MDEGLIFISGLVLGAAAAGLCAWYEISKLGKDLAKARRNDTPNHPVTGKFTRREDMPK